LSQDSFILRWVQYNNSDLNAYTKIFSTNHQKDVLFAESFW